MPAPRSANISRCILLLGMALAAEGRAQLTRLGGEFRVNTYTIGQQQRPAVASDQQGNFVVVWGSADQDGSASGIFARRFHSDGSAQLAEFRVNTYTPLTQERPAIAMADDGDFVVTWQSVLQDGSDYGIFGQRFDSGGARQGQEFRVNTRTSGLQRLSTVAMDSDGDFVVAWESGDQDGNQGGIFAQRFDEVGAPQGVEFQVNTYSSFAQEQPTVAIHAAGDFMIVWVSSFQDGAGTGVFGRGFNAVGVALANEFQVNTYTGSSEGRAAVAAARAGAFVAVWRNSGGQDGDGYAIAAQRLGASGSKVGTELQVNAYTASFQDFPDVAADSDGDFVVAWNSQYQDGNLTGVFARRFNATAGAQQFDSQVNSYVTSNQNFPAIAMNPGGDFVIAWQGAGLQDGSADGIFAQRFGGLSIDVDGNGLFDPLSDALLILRYAFGFRGTTLTTGAVGAGCTRCTAAEIETFLDSII